MSCAGLILAAGLGRRFGRPKAWVELEGKTLLDRAVENLLAIGCSPVVAVVPPGIPMRESYFPGKPVVALSNPDPQAGLGSSLALGARYLGTRSDVVGALIVLVDQIRLRPGNLRTLLAASGNGKTLAASRYGPEEDAWGPPVVLPRDALKRLRRHTGHQGARTLLEQAAREGLVRWVELPEAQEDWDFGPTPTVVRNDFPEGS